MHFAFTEEQNQFRDVIRKFFSDKTPTTEVRRLMATDEGHDPVSWEQMAQGLGVCGIHVPEQYGGPGFGIAELCIVTEEMGRSLFCGPFFSGSVLAASTLIEAGSEQQKQQYLPRICSGSLLATLAFTENNGSWAPESCELQVDADSHLSGIKSFVLDGLIADLFLVLGRDPDDGLSLYLVEGKAAGISREPLEVLDPTRKLSRITFSNVAATRLGEAGQGQAVIHKVLTIASIALAAEMVGGARMMLESALDYVKLRMQFGRKISSFQAIKHRCADLLLEVELASAAACYAAAAADDNDANLVGLSSLAKSAAADAYMHAAAECIQLHGGIGFTWDHDTHLWYKRAKSSEVFLGDPAWHRDRMMTHWQETGGR